jgi:hypothetical protein
MAVIFRETTLAAPKQHHNVIPRGRQHGTSMQDRRHADVFPHHPIWATIVPA